MSQVRILSPRPFSLGKWSKDENEVRAHDEVPCITAIIPPRNPEEDFCYSAQPERSEGNPAVWGLSKRVRQPRPTQAAWPPLPKGGNLHPSTACQDGMQPRPVCSPWPKGGAYQKLSTLSPISLHYPSNKQPEPARGEFRLLL